MLFTYSLLQERSYLCYDRIDKVYSKGHTPTSYRLPSYIPPALLSVVPCIESVLVVVFCSDVNAISVLFEFFEGEGSPAGFITLIQSMYYFLCLRTPERMFLGKPNA